MNVHSMFIIAKKWKQPKCPSTKMVKNMIYLHNGILFNYRKEWSIDTSYRMDRYKTHHVEWKKPVTKHDIVVHFHLYEIPRMGKSMETEGRLVVSRGCDEGGIGSDC